MKINFLTSFTKTVSSQVHNSPALSDLTDDLPDFISGSTGYGDGRLSTARDGELEESILVSK